MYEHQSKPDHCKLAVYRRYKEWYYVIHYNENINIKSGELFPSYEDAESAGRDHMAQSAKLEHK